MIKVGFNILNILFLTLAIYFAIDIGYALLVFKLDMLPHATKTSGPSQTADTVRPNSFSYYQPILTRNLFHSKPTVAATDVKSKEIEIDVLDKTTLKLKLWGTVATVDQTSFAVIESEKERQQNLYRTGDMIEGALVKRILREKVVLTVKGKDEILEIEKPGAETAPSGRTVVRAPLPSPEPAIPTPVDSEAVPSVNPMSNRRITLQRTQIESSLGNIGDLMGEAKIEPTQSEGNAEGLLINNIKPNSLFRRMGLRNGDIILGVDGKTIQSVDDGLKLYDNLKKADTTSIEIKRRGQNQTIEYQIK
jgi:general secretion pathway protein C